MNTKPSTRKTDTTTARRPRKIAAAQATVTPQSAPSVSTKRRTKSTTAKLLATLPPALEDKSGSKQSRLIALLRSPAGASITQMMTLTDWQAHTIRGTISGTLRKKLGLNVTCTPMEDAKTRLYRIVPTASK